MHYDHVGNFTVPNARFHCRTRDGYATGKYMRYQARSTASTRGRGRHGRLTSKAGGDALGEVEIAPGITCTPPTAIGRPAVRARCTRSAAGFVLAPTPPFYENLRTNDLHHGLPIGEMLDASARWSGWRRRPQSCRDRPRHEGVSAPRARSKARRAPRRRAHRACPHLPRRPATLAVRAASDRRIVTLRR